MKLIMIFLAFCLISFKPTDLQCVLSNCSNDIDEPLMHPDLPSLLAIYNSTGGPNWKDNTGWEAGVNDMNADPCNGWKGVGCDGNGRVAYISLSNNNLVGVIPSEIGDLTFVKDLRMNHNNLSGSIPGSLGNLENVSILYLMDNNLSGCYDANLLNLCGLSQFRMENNIGLPWAGQKTEFCNTDGTSEQQSGAPCGLGGSGVFDDCECIFSGELCYSVEGILCMPWVQELANELECYNLGFGNVRSYSFAVAQYEGEPIFVANHGGQFASKVVSNTDLYTCDGELLESCTFSLGISTCDSTSIYAQLDSAPTIFYHCMNNVYPNCDNFQQHPDFDALNDFFYSTNGLQWTNSTGWRDGVQDPFSNPCDWLGIECDNNGRVSSLILRNNNLTGALPDSFGNLDQLAFLSIEFNEIGGDLPTTIGNFSKMRNLKLYENQFTGSIPADVSNMNLLQTLLLANNKLIGEIPDEISKLDDLIVLSLSDNMLEGSLPSVFSEFKSIRFINLNNNNLSGQIPAEYADLIELNSLDLANNNFAGEIPKGLFDGMTQLNRVDLSKNQFIGELPENLGNLDSMNTLLLQANNFSGCIPESYLNLCEYEVDLSNNLLLAWKGDYDMFCKELDQIGAPCDDGDDTNGTEDLISEDCNCEPMSVNVEDVDHKFVSIFPNPTSDIINISLNDTYLINYRIFNATGTVIINSTLSTSQIDISQYNRGLYIIEFSHPKNSKSEIHKVVKH